MLVLETLIMNDARRDRAERQQPMPRDTKVNAKRVISPPTSPTNQRRRVQSPRNLSMAAANAPTPHPTIPTRLNPSSLVAGHQQQWMNNGNKAVSPSVDNKRMPTSPSSCSCCGTPQTLKVNIWEYRLDERSGRWISFPRDLNREIERSFNRGRAHCRLSRSPCTRHASAHILWSHQDRHAQGDRNPAGSMIQSSSWEEDKDSADEVDDLSCPIRRTSAQWSYEDPPKAQDGQLVPGHWHLYSIDEMDTLERSLREAVPEVMLGNGRRCNLQKRVMTFPTDNATTVPMNTDGPPSTAAAAACHQRGDRYRMRRLCQTSDDARPKISQPPLIETTVQERRFRFGDPTDAEWRLVSQYFNGDPNMFGYELVTIHKVHNYEIYQDFAKKKASMGQTHNQVTLFHGCPQQTIPAICQEGFDTRLAGKNAAMFGKGSYFAKYPSYSHKFSDVGRPVGSQRYYMIVSQVLIGRFTQGQRGLVRPPRVHPGGKLFDSVVDSMKDPHIFVVFEKAQAYPDFVISYQKSSPPHPAMRDATSQTFPNSTLSPRCAPRPPTQQPPQRQPQQPSPPTQTNHPALSIVLPPQSINQQQSNSPTSSASPMAISPNATIPPPPQQSPPTQHTSAFVKREASPKAPTSLSPTAATAFEIMNSPPCPLTGLTSRVSTLMTPPLSLAALSRKRTRPSPLDTSEASFTGLRSSNSPIRVGRDHAMFSPVAKRQKPSAGSLFDFQPFQAPSAAAAF